MVNNGDIITFNVKKNFTYMRPLGKGGTGDTYLFRDETTDMMFAIKKYAPKDNRYIDEYYSRFVDEIKILFNLSHPNVVRIYNYYLYPDLKTGYLQMEYVDGKTIDEFEPDPWDKDWNDIFREVVSAFEYLEKHNILHRDIRPTNIMIDSNTDVKIIDFGFGKQLDNTNKEKNSILLNWPATEMPDEVELNHEYDKRTEIYFVGTMFRHLLKEYMDDFMFHHILEKMTKRDPSQRYNSFMEIAKDISSGVIGEIDFTNAEKEIYRNFANELTRHISYYLEKYSPISSVEQTLLKLAELIRQSSLEEYIQNNGNLIGCFIDGKFVYNSKQDIKVQIIIDFYSFVNRLSVAKQKILFDNIYTRLSAIEIHIEDEDLPF